jgi:hypothetical protein
MPERGSFAKEATMRALGLNSLIAMAGAAFIIAIGIQSATARIECQGNFMVTKKNGLIATPYCEEEQIAKVAQSYGWKVTAKQVHNDPLVKVQICQVLGGDVRLKGSCAGYGPGNYAPGR